MSYRSRQINTERLQLRSLQASDAEHIFTLRSDPGVNKYNGRKLAETVEDASNFIEKILAGAESGNSFYWAIVQKDQHQFAGTICLWNVDTVNKKGEIGYELLPQCQGKGFMYEALEAVIKFGFEELKLGKIDAELDDKNLSSIRLLEKCNFEWVAQSGDDPVMLTYRLLATAKES